MSPIWYLIICLLCVAAAMVSWLWGRKQGLFYFAGILSVIATVASVIMYDTYIRQPAIAEGHAAREAAVKQGAKHVTEDSFFAFIGEQLDIELITEKSNTDQINFYKYYQASYRIIEPIWGNYQNDAINFSAANHYDGLPAFAKNTYVMLFVSKKDDLWVHETNLYFPVHRTDDEKWAYCGDPSPRRRDVKPAKLHKINFKPPIYFNTQHLTKPYALEKYPEPIWLHENGIVTCAMGAYTDEVFRFEKEGVLKSRGLF